MAGSQKPGEDFGGKTALYFLLVLLSAALCALAAFHWVRESRLTGQLERQRTALDSRTQALTNSESSARYYQQQANKLEELRQEYTAALATNQAQAAAFKRDFDATRQQIERVESQSRLYREAVEQANATIRKQNDQIRFQNDEIKKFVAERNEAVQRYNRLATNFNDLARKWNLQQEELMRVSTNRLSR